MKNLILLSIAILFIVQVNAQNWIDGQKIIASDRAIDDEFGSSVAINGNFAVIGSPRETEDNNGSNTLNESGSAYIYEKDNSGNWIQIQKINPSDRSTNDVFGWSVAIGGDYLFVGAPGDYEDENGSNSLPGAGSVYIFKKDVNDNWNEVQKIVASDRDERDAFGGAIAISDDYAIIGAWAEDDDEVGGNNMSMSGSAYIFEKDNSGNWIETQKIVASERQEYSYFGDAVSLSGDYALVGCSSYEELLTGTTPHTIGAAFMFKRDVSGNWNEIQLLKAFNKDPWNYNFGKSVSIEGDYAIVGEHRNKLGFTGQDTLRSAGAAYIFKKDINDNWNNEQMLVASYREYMAFYGWSVAIKNEIAFVTAQFHATANGDSLYNSGAAFTYKRDNTGNWNEVQMLVANDRDVRDYYGYQVSFDGSNVIFGAYGEDHDPSGENPKDGAGSAYIYELPLNVYISENNINNKVVYYPNPTTGKLSIDLDQTYNNVEITISSIIGKVIYTQHFGSTNLVNFEIKGASGLYLVEVKTNDGNTAVLKVLKE